MTRLAAPALAALALGLAACTHAPVGAPAASKAAAAARAFARADLFPTNPGAVWQYAVVGHPTDDPYVDYPGVETVTLQQATRKGGRTTLQLRALDDFTNRYRFPELSFDEQGVTLRGVTYYGPMAGEAEGHAIDFLHLPLAAGTRWDDGAWIGQIKGEETVKVDAGTFKAWKVAVIGTYDQAYTAVGDYWIAPGVGIVKSELNTPAGIFECQLIPAGKAPKQAARKPWPTKR
jgi:hypothetical protein